MLNLHSLTSRVWIAVLTGALLAGIFRPDQIQGATYTDGSASFTVTFTSPPGGYNPRVDAFWVTDASGRFIQNVRRDAGSRGNYLYRWIANRGNWTAIDGFSGATISTWGTVTVTWDCRNTNNVIVPDGDYRFYVEFTDRNGQGWWTTNGIPFTKGTAPVNNTYPDIQYITGMRVAYTPVLTHDIAISGITPSVGQANVDLPIRVAVTNKSSLPESFTVTLSNMTSRTLVGTRQISNLTGNGSTNVTFNWATGGLSLGDYSFQAKAGPVTGETAITDNTRTSTITLRSPTHDVGVESVLVASEVRPNTTANVSVVVMNEGDLTESFGVVLRDDTDARLVGSNYVASLAGQSTTAVNFSWNTAGASLGNHTLRAVAGPVAGETNTFNNTAQALTLVAPMSVTNTLIVRGDTWRYNDTGTDLGTSWRQLSYNDSTWPQGRAPLGYGDRVTTTNRYGASSSAKYPTYYYRKAINLDARPSTLTLHLRRDDGAVVYHNGVEVYRVNMGSGAVTYGTFASATVDGANETTYFEAVLPVTNAVVGPNLFAVEIHQVNASSSDIVFDMELIGTVPPAVPIHDVAVTGISVPAQVLPQTTTNVSVTVANRGWFTESFTVTVHDETDAVAVGSRQVSNLASNGTTTVQIPWTVPAGPWVSHTLRAVAGPVTSELAGADNTNRITTLVSPIMETNVLVARRSLWRYNDTGADLTRAPWKEVDYYDETWAQGQGPFGYGDPVNTTMSFGPASTNKYPTYYFRRAFNIDVMPTAMWMGLRRDDGAVVYHNGVEIYRFNITDDPVTYGSWAGEAVGGAAETNYHQVEVPLTNAVPGMNLLAVEVHQSSPESSDVSFDLELFGVNPATPRETRFATVQVTPQDGAAVGDRLSVSVTVTNQGNRSGNVIVYLQDTNTQRVVASGTLTNVAAGGTASLLLDWSTLGFNSGNHGLRAYTVVNGVTNMAGAVTTTANLRNLALGLKNVSVAGSLGGRCNATAVLNGYLLVGAGASLEVWDRTNPARPTRLSSVRLPGVIENIAVGAGYAFAACGPDGLHFVDLTNPAAPVHRNSFDSSGHAYDVAVSGSRLYLADGVSGVRVFDIANPASPVLAGSYYTFGPARAIAVAGSTAYVLDEFRGLVMLDAANPAAMTRSGSFEVFDAGEAFALSGNLACIATGNGELHVVGITNGTTAVSLGSLVLGAVGQSVAINGTTAFVAAGDAGLLLVNIANPSAPTLMQALTSPDQASDFTLSTPYGYLANGFAGVQVWDFTQANAPVLAHELDTGLRGADVAVANDRAYVAAGEAGFRIYTLTNPAAPRLLGICPGVANARSIALAGNLACVGDGQAGFKLVDVTNPADPQVRGTYTTTNLGAVRSIAANASRVLLTDGFQVLLVNITDPTNPALLSRYAPPGFAYSVAMADGKGYVACGTRGLQILNLTTGITGAGQYDTPGLATAVAVTGTRALVADGASGWLVLDVTNPATPTLAASSTTQGAVDGLALSGNTLVLARLDRQVQTLDVSTPLTPVPKESFGPLVRALRLSAGGRFALSAEDEGGLAIFSLGAPSVQDSDQDGIPDDWERQIVDADPNDSIQNITQVLPGDDFDGDGFANAQERLAGTSPIDANSVFAAALYTQPGSNSAAVRWFSEPGKIYTVYKSTNLSAGFQVLQDNVAATPPINTFQDPQGSGNAFYIIGVK